MENPDLYQWWDSDLCGSKSQSLIRYTLFQGLKDLVTLGLRHTKRVPQVACAEAFQGDTSSPSWRLLVTWRAKPNWRRGKPFSYPSNRNSAALTGRHGLLQASAGLGRRTWTFKLICQTESSGSAQDCNLRGRKATQRWHHCVGTAKVVKMSSLVSHQTLEIWNLAQKQGTSSIIIKNYCNRLYPDEHDSARVVIATVTAA